MHEFYSLRKGTNANRDGLQLDDIKGLFIKVYYQLKGDGFFDESFGYYCVDEGSVAGKVQDPDLQILLLVRKKGLWPIDEKIDGYDEDDFFDIIEFLYEYISKPIDGTYHNYNNCGMHWATFNKADGQALFTVKVNEVLSLYARKFELSEAGEILEKPEKGFEPIFNADVPSKDSNVVDRVSAATLRFRRHGSTIDDRRHAVRDLVDVLEYLRPKVKDLLTSQDEQDLFNIANNFGIRHHNDKQKTSYDTNIWLSWMFYFYLSTIHVILRKIDKQLESERTAT